MRVLDGAGRMVVLLGGAGAGKSTLLDAWVAARGGVLVDAGGALTDRMAELDRALTGAPSEVGGVTGPAKVGGALEIEGLGGWRGELQPGAEEELGGQRPRMARLGGSQEGGGWGAARQVDSAEERGDRVVGLGGSQEGGGWRAAREVGSAEERGERVPGLDGSQEGSGWGAARQEGSAEELGGRVVGIDAVGLGDGVLLRRLGPRAGVVVAAAVDPGVEGALTISGAELAFAEDETYQVLAGALGDAEAADELAPDLHLLTHGWPALVGLAGVWLGQHPGVERRGRLRALGRVDERLEEYLLAGVLDGLGQGEREVLRRLARVGAVDAGVADRLDVTEDLGAVPPFLQALARRPGWLAVADCWRGGLQRALPMEERAVAELRAGYAALGQAWGGGGM